MRQYIDLDSLWRKSRKRTIRDMRLENVTITDLPEDNPFVLEDLLQEDFDVDALSDTLRFAINTSRPGSVYE